MPGLDSEVTLLLHCNGADGSTTFADASDYSQTVTPSGNAQVDTAQSVFGGASLLLDGAGDSISTLTATGFDFATGNFCIECRARLNASGTMTILHARNNFPNDGVRIASLGNGALLGQVIYSGGAVVEINSTAGGFTTGAWFHLAFTRDGNTFRLFRDGEIVGGATSVAVTMTGGARFTIGEASGSQFFNGWIDEVRVSKGVSRFTATFTPQTSEYSRFLHEFLTTSDATFLNLQSGNARPYYYLEAIISGVTAFLGVSYDMSGFNWLIDGGVIDREKPVFPGDRSSIFSADVTIKVDNSTQRFSPNVTGSVFYNNDYLDSVVNYWAGFVNVSSTAELIQRGSFLLDDLTLDSRENVAYLRLRDKFKRALETQIGTNVDVSGTGLQYVATGTLDGRDVLISLFSTGASITATDLDIQTASISFNNISFSRQAIAEAASLIAEASDGFLFTTRQGLLKFESNLPIFGTSPAADFTMRESDWMTNSQWEQDRNDRVNKVSIEFLSGVSAFVVSEATGITGRTIAISNDSIQGTAEAVALASRLRDRFSGQVSRLEIRSVWAPSLEIGNILAIHSTSLGLISASFEIYKIQEEPTRNSMTLFCVNENRLTGKWGFWSHQTGSAAVGEHSAVFAGSGATESGGWQAGWLFWGRDAETATNPGFDADGNSNNVIDSGYAASGAGSTGIETLFQWY